MSSGKNSLQGIKSDGFQTQNYDAIDISYNIEAHLNPRKLRSDECINYFEDQEAMEPYSQMKALKEEIRVLREQISTACLKEMQLLNEKYALERKFSDLRMAIDEKQNEAITSAANELVRRKSDLEESLRLAHDLKVVDDERYVFMSSMLGLLAEYGIWPRVINASAISNSVKSLHDQLHWKITASHDSTREFASVGGALMTNESPDKIRSGILMAQGPHQSTVMHDTSTNPLAEEQHLETTPSIRRYQNENEFADKGSFLYNGNMRAKLNENKFQDFSFNPERNTTGSSSSSLFDNGFVNTNVRELTKDTVHPPSAQEELASSVSDEGPGIEGFQIIGDATPGEKLLGCGYPVRGTSLCMFQWVRHLEDGTRQYIEGATNPEYVVTVDDVDKLIAVECIPMDDQGRQGELVRRFANDQHKITCDPEMQREIDMFLTKGEASFRVLLLADSPDNWEPTTLVLKPSGYQIRSNVTETLLIGEKFSKDLVIKIPSGVSTQLVLACPNGSYYPLRTYDVRTRDTLVLTMRMFQTKALDEKRKVRA